MLLYMSVALYAPSLALSSVTNIPLLLSICLTAGLSGLYISLGGAKAGIHTSSLQMALILLSMAIILICSLTKVKISEIIPRAYNGGRLQLLDFRLDPRIRHSVWPLLIGGTGNILCLVVLLNIPFNFLILTLYVGVGLILYYFYYNCDPALKSKDQLLPYFVLEKISSIPGITGLFIASVYSAGTSTLSASYSALSAVVIEDVIKQYLLKLRNGKQLDIKVAIRLTKVLPLVFCVLTIVLAYLCSLLKTMVLQISLSIFGLAGGPVLAVFCMGFFFPFIKKTAAFLGQLFATIFCIFLAAGSIMERIRPVALPLDRNCGLSNTSVIFNYTDPYYGMVEPLSSTSLLVQLYRVSYQYYSTIAVLFAFTWVKLQDVVGSFNRQIERID
ncbi:unnamed protein product [Dracunculus medinensis]|uniref:Sodium-coupled monocarboxylate transporter 2 n=1 Tax=Dracunculus medinensis TaxID=318479 RepID=A0A0N4UM12_DRAME|nr:unnamed protein product [Dracunculus medinensis]